MGLGAAASVAVHHCLPCVTDEYLTGLPYYLSPTTYQDVSNSELVALQLEKVRKHIPLLFERDDLLGELMLDTHIRIADLAQNLNASRIPISISPDGSRRQRSDR